MTSLERVDPPLAGDEKATLLGFLDFHRDTLRMKTAGLDADQLNATLAPSAMTLGGMLKHLALVEDWWFSCVFLGREYAAPWDSVDWKADADWDWHSAVEDSPEELRALFDEACAASAAIVAEVDDWGTLSRRRGRTGEQSALGWIVFRMIGGVARHNGHADLIRESIDGETGE